MKKINYFKQIRGLFMLLFVSSTFGIVNAQNVEVRDADDNILMRVEDEGVTGSVYLNAGTTPSVTTNKLYNVGGTLTWNGSSIISPLWSLNGSDIYYNSGKVGIGVTSPSADLHVSGLNGALFSGTYGSGSIPVQGGGTRLMWYPKKAVFRAGVAVLDEWDDAQTGNYSFAFGYNVKASAQSAIAMGEQTSAENQGSVAIGSYCHTYGDYSVAIGYNNQTNANYAVALNNSTQANGNNSVAMGHNTSSSAYNSFAMGESTTASGYTSVAFGNHTTASGDYSYAMGDYIQASGNHTIAFALNNQGSTNVTQDNTMAIMGGKVGIGIINPLRKLEVVDNIDSYVTMIKNSNSSGGDGIRVVLQSGYPGGGNRFVEFLSNAGSYYSGYICGDSYGGVDYVTLSDKRLKMNIKDYRGALETISKIQVRQYEMKAVPGKEQIGFIAQELLEVYPQAVSGKPDGNVETDPMGIDYGRLTPLLVSAIQGQQKMIEEQNKMIEDMQVEINSLKDKLSEY